MWTGSGPCEFQHTAGTQEFHVNVSVRKELFRDINKLFTFIP